MREDAEKERVKQVEEEEKKNRMRRSSSPALRQTQVLAVERSAHSEPIPRRNDFVSSIKSSILAFTSASSRCFFA